jgi:hypothetical protein
MSFLGYGVHLNLTHSYLLKHCLQASGLSPLLCFEHMTVLYSKSQYRITIAEEL